MRRVLRPLVVFIAAGGFSLATLNAIEGAHGSSKSMVAEIIQESPLGFSLGEYRLEDLRILKQTLYYVDDTYVEPERIDWEKMYVSALEAVERRVPSAMFNRQEGGERLSLEVGDYRTVLDIPPIEGRQELEKQLRRVAQILGEHLTEDDIPTSRDTKNKFAEIEYAMVNGALGTLDPHSVLLPPADSKEMDVENQGSFGGLGITIVDRDGKLTIEYPLSDTPAERAGLKSDDQIVRIDGESTINMSLDEAVHRLRGPVGAPVDIEIMRDGYTEPKPVKIVRARIKLNPVKSASLEGGFGYISISAFHQNVAQDLRTELGVLTRENGGKLRGLVLDLRRNPGGFLTQAVKVSDTFLWDGDIVSTVDGDGKVRDKDTASAGGTQPRYPIVVLVNANSASASEIVAGALRNNDRAVIVGERTFGKGSVQNLHGFHDTSKLKLTISKYLTPGDRSIQSVGIPADIQLVPALVEPAKEAEGDDKAKPQSVRLFSHERVRREADLDHHLEHASIRHEEPAYSVRYRFHPKERAKSAKVDLTDYQIQFAREILLDAPGHRRADILFAAANVVERHRTAGSKEIRDAFSELGIDWSPGPPVVDPDLAIAFDLGEDNRLVAGRSERIALEVTNNSDRPIHELVAVASKNDILQGREFFFGKLGPGETRRYEHDVKLNDGYPSERTPVTFTFRDGHTEKLAVRQAMLPVQGLERPDLAWSWRVDDTTYGDGDGVVDLGEKLVVHLDVRNEGKGATSEAFGRIRNKSGRALDIVVGTVEPGDMQTRTGEPCEKGDTVEGDPRHCVKRVLPDATWSGAFEVEVKEARAEGYTLELSLGDANAYDHASVVRAGFYSYFTQQEKVEFELDGPLPTSEQRHTPDISITRAIDPVATGKRASVSGEVTDDSGIRDVMVFSGDDKIFYQGAARDAHLTSVPFTADLELKPGVNTVSVLATDDQGFTSSQTLVVWREDEARQAALEPAPDKDAPATP